MDASQYKDYVLVLLFVKYVSDKYAGQKDAHRSAKILRSFMSDCGGHCGGKLLEMKNIFEVDEGADFTTLIIDDH